MFKFKITNEEFEALAEDVRGNYKQIDDGYVLQAEGMPDIFGMEKKLQELLGERKADKQRREQAEEAARKAEEEAARKRGDVDTLEKSWNERFERQSKEFAERENTYKSQLHDVLVKKAASELAMDLGGDKNNALILERFIRDRLTVDNGKTRVLDAEGQPSAYSMDDLKKEFAENPAFANVIRASGSQGSNPSGARHAVSDSGDAKKMSEAERVKLRNENPQQFKQLFPDAQ